MSPLPEFRVSPNKETGSRILVPLDAWRSYVAAVYFSPQTFSVLTKCRFHLFYFGKQGLLTTRQFCIIQNMQRVFGWCLAVRGKKTWLKFVTALPCAFSNSVFSSAILMMVFFNIISHLLKPFLFNLVTVQSRSEVLVAHVISVITYALLPLIQFFLICLSYNLQLWISKDNSVTLPAKGTETNDRNRNFTIDIIYVLIVSWNDFLFKLAWLLW